MSKITARLVLLNAVLTTAVMVLAAAVLLTNATVHLHKSLAIIVISAVTAIVTSCVLSMIKRLTHKQDHNSYSYDISGRTCFDNTDTGLFPELIDKTQVIQLTHHLQGQSYGQSEGR